MTHNFSISEIINEYVNPTSNVTSSMPDFDTICTDRKLNGTSSSIFQHPTSDNNGEEQENSLVNSKAKNLSKL